MDFKKKFNIGLTLETNLGEFRRFLKDYSPYIRSVYFSMPVGKRAHTRSKVAAQFLLPHKVALFYRMLYLLKEYGIELEVLFNTLVIDREIVERSRELLDKKKIEVDSVCFLDDYSDLVAEFFPDKEYIYSFNNGLRSRSQIDAVIDARRVDKFVLASNFIRDNETFRHVNARGKKVYLILNNSCSFNCATCNNTSSLCTETFEKNLSTYPAEYLYALQSVFPDEIEKGLIDPELIDCFKISNRSSDLKFTANALDSYVNGNVKKYLAKDKNNFAIWGRAGFFWKHFKTMDINKIVEFKKQILKTDIIIK